MLVWFDIVNLVLALVIRAAGMTTPGIRAGKMLSERPGIFLSPILYFLSLFLSFLALKVIPVSIAAPIQCSDGIFIFTGVMILYLFFGNTVLLDETITPLKIFLVVLVILGIYVCALVTGGSEDREENRKPAKGNRLFASGRFAVLGVILAVLSAMFDAGSSLTDIYILSDISESFDYIYTHNLLMAAFSSVVYLYLCLKEKKIYVPFQRTEIFRMLGALCDCLGLLFYMVAASYNGVYTAAIVPGYCIFSVLLSGLLLKEKTGKTQKICIAFTILTIMIFDVVDEVM